MHEDKDGSVDVMRGEEVQVFGVLELYPDATKICLPGTHSKWVTVEDAVNGPDRLREGTPATPAVPPPRSVQVGA